jgi:hypothetical protein
MGRSGLGPCQLRPEANCAPPATYLFFATLAITSSKFASLQFLFSSGNTTAPSPGWSTFPADPSPFVGMAAV